jgi:DNA-binding response OmpR family regulator
MGKILVVDDQRNMRTTLAMMLRGQGYEVDEAADGAQGRELGATGAFDVVLTDLRMGEYDGIEVLRATKEAQPMTEVIVMTAYGTIESAVEAMRVGAFDYIQKPFTEQELIVKVGKAMESRKLQGQVQAFAREFKERYHLENIVGRSQPIRDVLTRVVKISPTDAIVLITGESGTGKELIARAVHANSKRAHRPFVTVNCAAISETLLESELFGHARGAFTGAISARKGLFEEADGGTFFFDEIAETTPAFQAKLLRSIQEGEIRRVGENKPVKVDIRASRRRAPLPAGLVLSAQRGALSLAPAARAPRRHPAAHRVLPRQVQPEDERPRAPGGGRHGEAHLVRLSGQRARGGEHGRAVRGALLRRSSHRGRHPPADAQEVARQRPHARGHRRRRGARGLADGLARFGRQS